MGYGIVSLSFFLENTHTGWMKAEKPILGSHFPPLYKIPIKKYINIANLWSGTSKTKNVSLPFEVESVAIVVILFRDISRAKKIK